MAEHDHPHVLAGPLAEHLGDSLADAAKALGVTDLRRCQNFPMTVDRLGALGHHHQGIHPPLAVPRANLGSHLVDVEWNFWDQNGMSATGDARVQCDPAGITAHDLDHHHPLMTFRRAVQAVQTLGGKTHGRVETEGGEGLVQIVVDGLGHAHDTQALLMQRIGDGERTVAANGNQRIEFLLRKKLEDLVGSIQILRRPVGHFHREMHWVALVGGTQDGAAQMTDAADLFPCQTEHAPFRITLRKHDAVEPLANSVALPAPIGGCDDHRPYHGVQAGGIAPAGADGYASDLTGHGNSCVGNTAGESVNSMRRILRS